MVSRGEEAIWIGHDWGAGVVWALVAYNPEVCLGVVNMAVPYRTLEMGLQELIKYANRELYPEEEYPHAQWGYQAFYESSERELREVHRVLREGRREFFSRSAMLRPKDVEERKNRPAFTANVVKDGGWFGGAEEPPKIPLEDTLLSEDLLASLVKAFKEGGFWAPTAYYLNHEANLKWSEGLVDQPRDRQSTPVLFVECLDDIVVGDV